MLDSCEQMLHVPMHAQFFGGGASPFGGGMGDDDPFGSFNGMGGMGGMPFGFGGELCSGIIVLAIQADL